MSNELCKIQDRVEAILELYPDTRNSDRLLIEIYYKVYHGVRTFGEYRNDTKLPTIESIRRSRQKIQADGRFRSDRKVNDERREKEVEYANHFGN